MLPPLSFVKRSIPPPQILRLPRGVSRENSGIKILGLHLRATYRERGVAHFGLYLLLKQSIS